MLFGILISPNKRNRLNNFLNKNGIETRICWPPIHKQPFHSKIFLQNNFQGAETIYSQIINLPMGNGLSQSDVLKIIQLIKNYLKF